MKTAVVVVKIGGSLFLQPNFASRLKQKIRQLAEVCSPAHLVLITGGGSLVDGLRSIDRVNHLPEEVTHWAAIHLMDMNSRLLQSWWPELPMVSSLQALQARLPDVGYTVFCMERFLLEQEPTIAGSSLFVGWEVTSDSIAARIASVLDAKKLILLKASGGPFGKNWQVLAADGVVDAAFHKYAYGLPNVSLQSLAD